MLRQLPAAGAEERTAALKTLRVLVADDHRLMQAAIRRALADADDFEIVHEVSVGSHVVPAVRETAPDVVLLDLRMPELDGLSCLERLRKHDPTVAVVILSSYSDPEQIEAARQGGARGYVVKTVEPVDLATVLRTALSSTSFTVWGAETEPAADQRGRRDRPERARDRRPRRGGARALEPRDRPPALDQRADGEVPPPQRLPQARHLEPDGGGAVRVPHGPRGGADRRIGLAARR